MGPVAVIRQVGEQRAGFRLEVSDDPDRGLHLTRALSLSRVARAGCRVGPWGTGRVGQASLGGALLPRAQVAE